MIGNDVVDLAEAKKESNWKRKGFLVKLFTAFEQELIRKATHQEEMVWMLWSIKESTYKAYQRIEYNRAFYPVKIAIQSFENIDKQYYATIFLFGSLFYGKTKIENDVIHTVVVQNKTDFKRIQKIKDAFISKDKNGLPFCNISNQPVSISHHGKHLSIIRLSHK